MLDVTWIDDPRPGGNRHRYGSREKLEEVTEKAEQQAEERLLDLLLPSTPAATNPTAGFTLVTEEAIRFPLAREIRNQLREASSTNAC